MMLVELPTPRPPFATRLVAAVALLALGCGQGLFDGAHVRDAGTVPDAATVPGTEAGGGETNGDEISKTIDRDGGELDLAGASLVIGPGAFPTPTRVTMRRIANIDHTGAYGPVFEISVAAVGLFRQDAHLTLDLPFIGANQPNFALGALDPSQPLADQQWVPVWDSALNQDLTSVTGSTTGFGTAKVLLFGAVVSCPPASRCRSGEACNASACQQCPTSSLCTP
jgi:hypothetical protein